MPYVVAVKNRNCGCRFGTHAALYAASLSKMLPFPFPPLSHFVRESSIVVAMRVFLSAAFIEVNCTCLSQLFDQVTSYSSVCALLPRPSPTLAPCCLSFLHYVLSQFPDTVALRGGLVTTVAPVTRPNDASLPLIHEKRRPQQRTEPK